MTPNPVKRKLGEGKAVVGTWLGLADPIAAEAIAALGFDATYYERANDEILVVLQIEHIDSVRRIDEILSVPGVDACYIGPNDLCASMGLVPSLEPAHPEFEEAIQAIKRSALKHGVPPGIHCATPETVTRRIAEGWRFLGILGDMGFMVRGARAAREAIKTE